MERDGKTGDNLAPVSHGERIRVGGGQHCSSWFRSVMRPTVFPALELLKIPLIPYFKAPLVLMTLKGVPIFFSQGNFDQDSSTGELISWDSH